MLVWCKMILGGAIDFFDKFVGGAIDFFDKIEGGAVDFFDKIEGGAMDFFDENFRKMARPPPGIINERSLSQTFLYWLNTLTLIKYSYTDQILL